LDYPGILSFSQGAFFATPSTFRIDPLGSFVVIGLGRFGFCCFEIGGRGLF
jgi:hypothetical protein